MFSTRSELAIFKYNLLSYCGIVDARISASEKDLPAKETKLSKIAILLFPFFSKTFTELN